MSWQYKAACGGENAPLFFGPEREGRPDRENREVKAAAICASCPVRTQCLEYALRLSVKHGIWGGLSPEERARERRRRTRRLLAA